MTKKLLPVLLLLVMGCNMVKAITKDDSTTPKPDPVPQPPAPTQVEILTTDPPAAVMAKTRQVQDRQLANTFYEAADKCRRNEFEGSFEFWEWMSQATKASRERSTQGFDAWWFQHIGSDGKGGDRWDSASVAEKLEAMGKELEERAER